MNGELKTICPVCVQLRTALKDLVDAQNVTQRFGLDLYEKAMREAISILGNPANAETVPTQEISGE